jgi:hypothetical protein
VSCCCDRQRFGERQRGTMCTEIYAVKNPSLALLKMFARNMLSWSWTSINCYCCIWLVFYITLPVILPFISNCNNVWVTWQLPEKPFCLRAWTCYGTFFLRYSLPPWLIHSEPVGCFLLSSSFILVDHFWQVMCLHSSLYWASNVSNINPLVNYPLATIS